MRGRYAYAHRATRVGLWLARAALRAATALAIVASWLATVAATVAVLAADTIRDLLASSSLVMDPGPAEDPSPAEDPAPSEGPAPEVIDVEVIAVHDTHPHERTTTS